jgi:hypothetical protein
MRPAHVYRESLSMPVKENNSGSRELRMIFDTQGGEKFKPKGIERVHRCPRRRKKQPNGN